MVEPVHPFQGRELYGLKRSPGSAPMDRLGFVEADLLTNFHPGK